MLKRNQIMITALAIMIAVAGYLNFAGTKAGEEKLTSADAGNAEEDMTALLDLSEEDVVSDIDSMDSDLDGVAAGGLSGCPDVGGCTGPGSGQRTGSGGGGKYG